MNGESCAVDDPDDPTDSDPYFRENTSASGDYYADYDEDFSYTNDTTGESYDSSNAEVHYDAKISIECAPDGGFPDLVTGHTVYMKFVMKQEINLTIILRENAREELGLATDFAAVAGYWLDDRHINITIEKQNRLDKFAQRECVVWFNGENLDQQPEADAFSANQSFPSDEDETGDTASQDYDFDRDVDGCGPWALSGGGGGIDRNYTRQFSYGSFAVAVEQGDCNPALGADFRYRGHLDFIDPNGIYHEVQEYDYVCGANPAATAAKDLFPWTGTDPHNTEGCKDHKVQPAANTTGGTNDSVLDEDGNVSAGGAWLNYGVDLGQKCNGSIQDLFTERLWITRTHAPQYDPTIADQYTFALLVDTCDGLSPYDEPGKPDTHHSQGNNTTYPGGSPGGLGYGYGTPQQYVKEPLGATEFGQFKSCTDGSSFSFDDTNRGSVTHAQSTGSIEEIMRGNSVGNGTTVPANKHREDCRYDTGASNGGWPKNSFPPGTNQTTCYPEDHQTAAVDIFVYDTDPTGLFEANSGGRSAAWAGAQSANWGSSSY